MERMGTESGQWAIYNVCYIGENENRCFASNSRRVMLAGTKKFSVFFLLLRLLVMLLCGVWAAPGTVKSRAFGTVNPYSRVQHKSIGLHYRFVFVIASLWKAGEGMKYNFTHALGDLCRTGVMLKRNILVQTMYGLWIGASFKRSCVSFNRDVNCVRRFGIETQEVFAHNRRYGVKERVVPFTLILIINNGLLYNLQQICSLAALMKPFSAISTHSLSPSLPFVLVWQPAQPALIPDICCLQTKKALHPLRLWFFPATKGWKMQINKHLPSVCRPTTMKSARATAMVGYRGNVANIITPESRGWCFPFHYYSLGSRRS